MEEYGQGATILLDEMTNDGTLAEPSNMTIAQLGLAARS